MKPDPEYAVDVDEAMDCLAVDPEYDCGNGPEPCVHTFAQASIGLLGAHWSLDSIRPFFEKHGVSRSGEFAQDSGHGLVVVATEHGHTRTLFFATARTPRLLSESGAKRVSDG